MLEAQIRGTLDYSTYDYSEAWRRRESFILLGVSRAIAKEIQEKEILSRAALVSSGKKFKDVDPQELLIEAKRKYANLSNWRPPVSKDRKSVIRAGKLSGEVIIKDEIPPEYAKLVEQYRQFEARQKSQKVKQGSNA